MRIKHLLCSILLVAPLLTVCADAGKESAEKEVSRLLQTRDLGLPRELTRELNEIWYLHFNETDYSIGEFCMLMRLPKLSEVALTGWALEDWVVDHLLVAKALNDLSLNYATGVTEERLRALKVLPIEILSFESEYYEPGQIRALSECPELKRLWISFDLQQKYPRCDLSHLLTV